MYLVFNFRSILIADVGAHVGALDPDTLQIGHNFGKVNQRKCVHSKTNNFSNVSNLIWAAMLERHLCVKKWNWAFCCLRHSKTILSRLSTYIDYYILSMCKCCFCFFANFKTSAKSQINIIFMLKFYQFFTNINIMRVNNSISTLNTPCVALDNRFVLILYMKSVSKE